MSALLLFAACRPPAPAVAPVTVPRDAVGLNLHADRLPVDDAVRQLDAVRALGVGHVRLAVEWGQVEPAPGAWDWTVMDRMVELAEARDVEILEVLAYNARWNADPPGDPMTRPVDMDAWAAYVRAMATRYRGRIRTWEVWNEPNVDTFLRSPGYAGHPERRWSDYRDILEVARRELKAVDPDNVVVFGGIAHGSDDWWRDLEAYEAVGAVALCDVMAIHPYVGADPYDPRWYPRYVDEMLTTLARHGHGEMEVWVTEIGIPTGGHELAVTEAVQAEWLVGLFDVPLSRPTVKRVYWYALQDEGGEQFGLLRADGAWKPSAARLRGLVGE